jgi:hypothetical protein
VTSLFQDWGNQSKSYQVEPRRTFLQSLNKEIIDQDVEVLLDVGATRSDASSRLVWDYEVPGLDHHVIVLDARRWRGFPPNEKSAALISMKSPRDVLSRQLGAKLARLPSGNRLTLIASPAPIVGYLHDLFNERLVKQSDGG